MAFIVPATATIIPVTANKIAGAFSIVKNFPPVTRIYAAAGRT